MYYKINIPLEFMLTGIQAVTLWLLFYLLYRPESKARRILLACFIILWRPLHIIVNLAFTLGTPTKIILQAAAFLGLILLSEGKRRNKFITAIYLWNIGLFMDVGFSCLFAGVTGRLALTDMNTLYLEMTVTQTAMLLWAVFYYLMMRTIPQEAFDRISLRFWLIAILTPFLGAALLFASINPLKVQLEAGFNNFLLLGIFSFVILILDLCIFYLYLKLITSYHSRLLAGELAKTPPVYTIADGLSPAFIEKYDLSKRQIEIVEALLQGKSNKEIAVALKIEVNTVQVHLQNVYRKTGAPGRYAIMALVGQSGNKA
ncbi:helix-turn-helix transcriptional regulator [Brucepastera parasyntrophica]|uniref:helix-turn-helix transcriptional regulator n=1 Tax=Brucepastera parasyntrophica TaxID=2880008 RepID=UPI00210A2CA9|nr:helix-turn-helix transcriptional regulator [Brucepastera parasyntrophica]ULQ58648.1 helix-turn-helix transcriptional regulator [Brucepastera parasyntrophica]